jgi:enoyl-CoA hydratase/carnithine racemase
MNSQPAGHIAVEGHAGVLVARIDGGPHALFDPEIAKQLKVLVDRADRDPDIHAVVFTGTHPDRFLSHSDVRWLQKAAPDSRRSTRASPSLQRARRDSSTGCPVSERSRG